MKIRDMKAGEKKERRRPVLRCPHCGSTDITYELGLITGYKYHCKSCQYVGALVIQDEGGKEAAECRKSEDAKEASGEPVTKGGK